MAASAGTKRKAKQSAGPHKSEAPADSLARRAAWWLLVAAFFLVPLAMSNFTFLGFQSALTADQFDLIKMVLLRTLALGSLACSAYDLLTRGGKLVHSKVDWLVLAFVAWAGLATLFSIHPATALLGQYGRYQGLLTFGTYAIVYFLALQFAQDRQRVRTLATAVFWSSVIVAGYGCLQFLGIDPVRWGTLQFEAHRAFATYGNPDLLGEFLAFSTPVALALALAEERTPWRIAYWAGFGVNLAALIATFARGSWIGGAVGLVLVAVVAWRHEAKLRRIDLVPVAAIVGVGAVMVAGSLGSSNEVTNVWLRLRSAFALGQTSGKTRLEIWSAAVSSIEKRPVLGWGPDTFRLVFPQFKPLAYSRDAGYLAIADEAHNYPLELALGTGVPGALLACGVFVWTAVLSAATVFRRDSDAEQTVRGAFAAAAAALLVALMLAPSNVGTGFLLWAAVAIVLAPTASTLDVEPPRWGRLAGIAALVLAGIAIVAHGTYLAADRAYLLAAESTSPASAVNYAESAVRLNPLVPTYRTQVGLAYTDQMNDALAQALEAQQAGQDPNASVALAQDAFTRGQQAFEAAIRFTPSDFDNYVHLANLNYIAGESFDPNALADAIRVAEQGATVEPFGAPIHFQLARALIATGKTAEATKQLEFAVQLDPAYGDAALLLAQVYEQAGRPLDALKVLRAADGLVGGQPGVRDEIGKLEASSTVAP